MEIRRIRPTEVDELVLRLHSVQQRAYAVEAALIGDDRIPVLHESPADLRAAELSWLTAWDQSELLGALAFTVQGRLVDIDRLVVAPDHHRRGIGRALVSAVLTEGARAVVSTGRDNSPARRLYESLGFRHLRDREVLAGLWVSDFELP